MNSVKLLFIFGELKIKYLRNYNGYIYRVGEACPFPPPQGLSNAETATRYNESYLRRKRILLGGGGRLGLSCKRQDCVVCQVLTALTMGKASFWDVTP